MVKIQKQRGVVLIVSIVFLVFLKSIEKEVNKAVDDVEKEVSDAFKGTNSDNASKKVNSSKLSSTFEDAKMDYINYRNQAFTDLYLNQSHTSFDFKNYQGQVFDECKKVNDKYASYVAMDCSCMAERSVPFEIQTNWESSNQSHLISAAASSHEKYIRTLKRAIQLSETLSFPFVIQGDGTVVENSGQYFGKGATHVRNQYDIDHFKKIVKNDPGYETPSPEKVRIDSIFGVEKANACYDVSASISKLEARAKAESKTSLYLELETHEVEPYAECYAKEFLRLLLSNPGTVPTRNVNYRFLTRNAMQVCGG